MSFKSDIAKFREKAEKAADAVFRGTALSLFGKIIMRTRVDTGRLRGNWQTTINRPSSAPVERIGGGAAQTEAASTTARAKIGDSIFITNNLPYAPVEENRVGMVSVTTTEFQRAVRENIKR